MSIEEKLLSENGVRDLGKLSLKGLQRKIEKIEDIRYKDPNSLEAKIHTVIVKIEGEEKVLRRQLTEEGLGWNHDSRLTKGVILTALLNDTGGASSRFVKR